MIYSRLLILDFWAEPAGSCGFQIISINVNASIVKPLDNGITRDQPKFISL